MRKTARKRRSKLGTVSKIIPVRQDGTNPTLEIKREVIEDSGHIQSCRVETEVVEEES